ncbi:HD-GYP domain-containing protein [Fusibacter sp. JL216-2]|uniref:HD-GYP domain-containing protein n=1 Tax=Fusibacter sp. JL216-2 TaxID=3071453 RepID=UPI003D339CFA
MKRIPRGIDALKSGMILGETIFDSSGNTLLSDGIILRQAYIEKIKGLGYLSVQIQVEANETVKVEQEIENKDDSAASRDLIIRTTREEATVLVKSCMKNVSVDTEIDVDKLYLIVNTIIDEIFSSEEITVNLANLKSVDEYVFEHSVNVCILSVICGIYMGFNKVRLVELGIGALLHDIGKGLISQETLNKPGTLTSDEFDEIKKHTILGYEALKRIPNITETSACVALYHHERFDGAGYPTGKKAQNIHVYAKIVAVADVFDAITSDRVYGAKENPYKAMEYILKSSEAHFDKEIVRVFLKAVGYYPLGLNVILSTGEYGMVTKKDRDLPTVRVLIDSRLRPIKGYYEVDLRKNPKVRIHDIDPHRKQMGYSQLNDGISG